jgi:hypothetical protein
MRRTMLIIVGGLMLSGCVASTQSTAQRGLTQGQYTPAPAVALTFDPKLGVPAQQYARDDRDMRAFGGFLGESTEIYDIQTDDDFQVDNFPSTYERRVQSDKIGEISR